MYMAWALHCSTARVVENSDISMAFAKDKIETVMNERNLAESHVAYLQKEIAKYHRSGWKEGKR